MVIYTFVFGVVFDAEPRSGDPSGLHVSALFLLRAAALDLLRPRRETRPWRP